MALDASYIGRTYPPRAVYEVGREKIREFADAIGDPNPVYRDASAAKALGHPDVVAPPTFPIAITWPAAAQVIHDPELGLDFSRVVHGDQKFTYARPIHADDRLLVTVVVDDITSRAGNDFLTIRTEVTTADGEPVVTTYAKLVVRAAQEIQSATETQAGASA